MDGLIVVDKAAGCTSHDVVLRIRRILGVRKAGHCGTLDPDATGILLLTIGRAVRFFPFLSRLDKIYEAAIRLGFSTETYDASGRPTSAEVREYPSETELLEAMRRWEGEILQTSPLYSAKKVGGRPMHRLVRAGREVPPRSSKVVIREFRLLEYEPPRVLCRIVCSSGTYIRSLAHDLGEAVGCGAHLGSLRRTAVGPHTPERAWTVERIEEEVRKGGSAFLIPPEELLPDIPAIRLDGAEEARVRNGLPIAIGPAFRAGPGRGPEAAPPLVRLFGPSGNLVALARPSPEGDRFRPFLVLPPPL